MYRIAYTDTCNVFVFITFKLHIVWRYGTSIYVKTIKTLPKHSEDVTRAGSIFAAVDTGTKLTERLKDVDIVAAHKVLGQFTIVIIRACCRKDNISCHKSFILFNFIFFFS